MPTTRSSAVKQEPTDENTANMSSPTFNATLRHSSHPYAIESLINPTEHPPSSGSTVRNSDIDMVVDGRNSSDMSSENVTNGNSTTSTFAELPRKLIKVIQKLDSLSIDATLPSLPKIVVVGDQSHGKSSIIEAVCDITVPRSEGTCTRCPFQITTTGCNNSANWSCKISLVRRFSFNPKAVAGQKYPHWDDTGSQNSIEFAFVTEKSLLEHALRLAQIAILNPQMNPAEVLHTNNPDMATRVNFSPNSVNLEIAHEDLPELSLLDLPGAINVAENANEQHLVHLIQRLIKTFVKDDKALILLAVAASADTDTSTAFKLVNESKALSRCVGVLTKPDLITRTKQQIKRILNDEIFKLGNGWFVTKQLSPAELDEQVSHSEARKRERTFFATQEPWCGALAEFSERFGIPRLQEALSNKLSEHILNELPEINARVANRLRDVGHELSKFPEQIRDPRLTIIREIEKVASVIGKQLRGDGTENKFRTDYRNTLRDLRKRLHGARPQLLLGTPGVKKPTIEIDSDDENMGSPEPSPAKTRKGNDGRAIISSTQTQQFRAPRIKTEEEAFSAPPKAVFTLDKVKRAYDNGTTSGLPDLSNPKVTETLALECLQCWPAMIDSTLEEIKYLMVKMLSESIETTLATRRETRFFRDATQVVENLFLELLQKQEDLVHTIVACETHKPITYDNEALKSGRDTARQKLQEDRISQRTNEHFDKVDSSGGKPTKTEERAKKAIDATFIKALGPDPYRQEIDAMATPIAYYNIASTQVLDSIAKHLEFGLIDALEKGLQDRLQDDLKSMDEDYCVELLAEDPRRENLRRRLLAEKEKLAKAMDELQGLPNLC